VRIAHTRPDHVTLAMKYNSPMRESPVPVSPRTKWPKSLYPGVEMIGNSAAAELLERIRLIWQSAQSAAVRSVNSAHVCANWLIGRQIVEAEQGGSQRAEYGRQLLESLSKALATEFGSGFSVSALRYMRLFYLGYPNLIAIHHALRAVSVVRPAAGDWRPGVLHPSLLDALSDVAQDRAA
jgi:hypothetical protein